MPAQSCNCKRAEVPTRYAIAVWNYLTPETRVIDLIREFVASGYNTISLSSSQFRRNNNHETEAVADIVHSEGLGVTIHCAFDFGAQGVQHARELFGDHLLAVTFDPLMQYEPRGTFYDTATMMPTVSQILSATEGSTLRVGVEDFPLDLSAVQFYHDDLTELMANPRYGMLLDVGHLNIRLRACRYFAGMSVRDYIRAIPVPIIEVHLHDNHGIRDEHGPFGQGTVDFAGIASALRQVGFSGVSTVEIAPSLHNSTPAMAKPHAHAALAKWRTLWET